MISSSLFVNWLFFYFVLLLYFSLFYKSNGFQDNFYIFKAFSYKFFFINLEKLDRNDLSKYHVMFCIASLVFIVITFFIFFQGFTHDFVEGMGGPYFSGADQSKILQHIEMKQKLIDELNWSNKILKQFLMENGSVIEKDENIARLISQNKMAEISLIRQPDILRK